MYARARAAGLSGAELLFGRVLDKGTSYTFDYQEQVEHAGPPQCWTHRELQDRLGGRPS